LCFQQHLPISLQKLYCRANSHPSLLNTVLSQEQKSI
jgi:hypothetical protein